jgi:hypothetical protein
MSNSSNADNIIPQHPLVFDSRDINYLVKSNLDLRGELSALRQKLRGESDFKIIRYYKDLIASFELAIEILKIYEIPASALNSQFITVESLKKSVDIVDITGRYTRLLKSGRNFRACCPFHNEKSPSFFVYPDKQTWHCFGACSTGGDVISLIMKAENTDFKGALTMLRGLE